MERSFVFPNLFVSMLRGYPSDACANRGLSRWATTTAIRMSPLRGYLFSSAIFAPLEEGGKAPSWKRVTLIYSMISFRRALNFSTSSGLSFQRLVVSPRSLFMSYN